MPQKSDKPHVLLTILCTFVAICLFTFAWTKQFLANLSNIVFLLVEIGAWCVFIVEAIQAYRGADDESKEWKTKAVVYLGLAIIFWNAGWAAGKNERDQVIKDSHSFMNLKIKQHGNINIQHYFSLIQCNSSIYGLPKMEKENNNRPQRQSDYLYDADVSVFNSYVFSAFKLVSICNATPSNVFTTPAFFRLHFQFPCLPNDFLYPPNLGRYRLV